MASVACSISKHTQGVRGKRGESTQDDEWGGNDGEVIISLPLFKTIVSFSALPFPLPFPLSLSRLRLTHAPLPGEHQRHPREQEWRKPLKKTRVLEKPFLLEDWGRDNEGGSRWGATSAT